MSDPVGGGSFDGEGYRGAGCFDDQPGDDQGYVLEAVPPGTG